MNTRTEITFLQAAINFLFIVIFTNEIPKQFTVILFAAKGMIYLLCSHIKGDLFTYEDNILFSRVKISCFHVKAHLVFFYSCLHNKISFMMLLYDIHCLVQND